MICFSTTIEKFDKQGEKTGWTYIEIPVDMAEQINPSIRVSYRVKGILDKIKINQVTILPMGEGNFIMPLNADIRKKLKKSKGDTIQIQLELDKTAYEMNPDLIACLEDDIIANEYFNSFPKSHQRYYSKWVDAAKTDTTKAKRIALILKSMHLKLTYSEMLRSNKE
jgi:hypothetical protein